MSERQTLKTVLVTGGAGFIGSHTVVELVNSGYTPVIVDDFSNSDRSVLDRLEKIIGAKPECYDCRYQDKEFLAKIFKEHKVDGVIHFAAFKSNGESLEKPLKYFQNNVAGLVTLLNAMEQAGLANLIFSSSATVYGEAKKLPITEDSPVMSAASAYGSSKQIGEIIVYDVTKASKHLKSLSLRYFNPIGAHDSALIGELPKGVPANLVPFLTQAVAGLRDELTVFGNDYPTQDGTCIRDYIHVVDLAKAHIKALEYINNQKPGFNDVCNIGTGKGASVMEVIDTFEKSTGQKVPYKIGPRREGDVVESYASVDKAHDMLGWKAEKSLAEALADAWRWQQKLKTT